MKLNALHYLLTQTIILLCYFIIPRILYLTNFLSIWAKLKKKWIATHLYQNTCYFNYSQRSSVFSASIHWCEHNSCMNKSSYFHLSRELRFTVNASDFFRQFSSQSWNWLNIFWVSGWCQWFFFFFAIFSSIMKLVEYILGFWLMPLIFLAIFISIMKLVEYIFWVYGWCHWFFLAIFISIIKMVEYILGFWLIPVIFFWQFSNHSWNWLDIFLGFWLMPVSDFLHAQKQTKV